MKEWMLMYVGHTRCYLLRRCRRIRVELSLSSVVWWHLVLFWPIQTASFLRFFCCFILWMVSFRLPSFQEYSTVVDLDGSPTFVLSLYSVIRMWSGYFSLFSAFAWIALCTFLSFLYAISFVWSLYYASCHVLVIQVDVRIQKYLFPMPRICGGPTAAVLPSLYY
jgi:hypothetical protein